MMRRRLGWTVAVALFVGAGTGGYAWSSSSDAEQDSSPFGVTKDGRTLGTFDEKPEDPPDLVLVVGDQGKTGYVELSEMLDEANQPKTPAEATEYQAKSVDRVIPVYDKTGTTVIDQFTMLASKPDPTEPQ